MDRLGLWATAIQDMQFYLNKTNKFVYYLKQRVFKLGIGDPPEGSKGPQKISDK